MYLTWLDSNSWLIEMGGKRILLDPWLVGSLTFGGLDWLFKGYRQQEHSIPSNIDLILLSQGLPDHSHLPTLEMLDRSIPVVGSAGAAKVTQELGYRQVTALAHGETFKLDQVQIEAVPGSPIGPTLVENGYLLKDLQQDVSLYYEPHGYHDRSLNAHAPIDVVITPLMDLALPLVGAIIKGNQSALELVRQVQPQVIMSTAGNGDVVFEGLLASALKTVGGVDAFRSLLSQNNLTTQVIDPKPGDRFELQLERMREEG